MSRTALVLKIARTTVPTAAQEWTVNDMATWYNAQLLGSEGRYCIQFETSDYQQFKLVEHACQQAVDMQNLILAAKKDGE